VSDTYAVTLEEREDNIEMEFTESTLLEQMAPYLQDIYPVEIEPDLPLALQEPPFMISLDYSAPEIAFSKTWRLTENAQDIWQQLSTMLKGYDSYSTETHGDNQCMACTIRGYGLDCILNGDRLKIEYKYITD